MSVHCKDLLAHSFDTPDSPSQALDAPVGKSRRAEFSMSPTMRADAVHHSFKGHIHACFNVPR
jgi:hypothetical protein